MTGNTPDEAGFSKGIWVFGKLLFQKLTLKLGMEYSIFLTSLRVLKN